MISNPIDSSKEPSTGQVRPCPVDRWGAVGGRMYGWLAPSLVLTDHSKRSLRRIPCRPNKAVPSKASVLPPSGTREAFAPVEDDQLNVWSSDAVP